MMRKSSVLKLFLVLCLLPFGLSSQQLIYKLKSKVILRNWQLSSRAYVKETHIQGASIELFEGLKLLSKTTTDAEGNFEINLPSSGNYVLVINNPGCNPKKFIINCNSIVIKNGASDFIPSVDLTGIIAAKVMKDVGDMGLSYPKVIMVDGKNQEFKYGGLNFPVNMNDGDIRMIQKFCTCNKLGDMALQNKNFELARNYYLMASTIFEKEEYPKEQLKRVDEKIKEEMFAEKGKMKARKAVASKKQVTTPISVSPQYNSSQKSGSSGRKVLPVLGGKK